MHNALQTVFINGKLSPWGHVFICVFVGLMADGMDLIFLSFSLSSLSKEFMLSPVEAGSLGSITLLGMAAGGFLGGWAADRFGRVKTMVTTLLVFSLGTGALAITDSFYQFAAVRFVSAVGLGAEYVVGNTLMAEFVPTKYRTTVLGTLQAGYSVGYVVAALLSGWILPTCGWRWLFAVGLLPVAFTLYARIRMPESPAWLEAKALRAQHATGGGNAPKQSSWGIIFASASSRAIFIAWAATSVCLQFGYFGVNTWLPSYVEAELNISIQSLSGYLACTYSAMIFGKILAGVASDTFGRKRTFAFGGIATAAFMPVIILYHNADNILYLLTAFGFFYGIQFGVNATYMTESFATEVRALAVGGAYNIGRAGAILSPVLIGYAALNYSMGAGFIVTGAAFLLSALIPFFFIKEKLFNPQGTQHV